MNRKFGLVYILICIIGFGIFIPKSVGATSGKDYAGYWECEGKEKKYFDEAGRANAWVEAITKAKDSKNVKFVLLKDWKSSGQSMGSGSVGFVKGNQTLEIKDGITIELDLNGHSIDGTGKTKSTLFFVEKNAKLILKNGTVLGGNGTNGGAVYVSEAEALIANVTFKKNKALGPGGAIFASRKSLTIMENCKVYDNEAEYGGGVASQHNAVLRIDNSSIHNNYSDSYGGGVYAGGEGINITNTSIENNSANDRGAGIYFSNSSQIGMVDNCKVNSNCADDYGGGLYFDEVKKVGVRATQLTKNTTVNDDGGGVYIDCDNVILDGCTITDNEACTSGTDNGGGVYVNQGNTVSLAGKLVVANNYKHNITIKTKVVAVAKYVAKGIANFFSRIFTGENAYENKEVTYEERTKVASNIYFANPFIHSAKFYDLGLLEGSQIGVTCDGTSEAITDENHFFAKHHLNYFKSDIDKELVVKNIVNRKEGYYATILGENSDVLMHILIILSVIFCVIFICVGKRRLNKRKGGEVNEK